MASRQVRLLAGDSEEDRRAAEFSRLGQEELLRMESIDARIVKELTIWSPRSRWELLRLAKRLHAINEP